MNELIDKYYPPLSTERRDLRKKWNKSQVRDWNEFLEMSATGEHWLEDFKVIAAESESVGEFMTKAKKVQVPGEVAEHFRSTYSLTPYDSVHKVSTLFYNKFKS